MFKLHGNKLHGNKAKPSKQPCPPLHPFQRPSQNRNLSSSKSNGQVSGLSTHRRPWRTTSDRRLCVYTRSSLKTKVLKDLTGISSSGFHQLWVQIQHNKLRSILLCVTYRPPDCPTNCFVDDFMDTYTQALTRGKKIFVVGDLNCDMLKILPETDTLNNLCSS